MSPITSSPAGLSSDVGVLEPWSEGTSPLKEEIREAERSIFKQDKILLEGAAAKYEYALGC